ncbi:MinD/ParA family protein [Thiomicrorhabdus sp. ZW0627]|uniref:MinD/ParA family protein n=1 Tax=Thiomicrorhabdus sp. ZW0627 TaxID=3039774 RepID=UPI002436DAD5|nr:MinD/ParA family protein [Thiomicrorhabdus sp. ZW0627]MDG6773327.1 MinD/ParA family protein [Thiomicrorhabdus sp. ZW0627]
MLNDQAAGLRAMQSNQMQTSKPAGKPVRVIAVASGKGGVGKTNVSVNLGISLSKMGNRVLLMDADMGLANVDIMLGLQTKYNLAHVLDGEKTLKEVIVEGPAGLKIIPAASGVKRMAQLTAMENAGIINAFSELNGELDVLIIDTAAGIADSVVSFCRASQEVVVVVTDEPASITDAYALIKVLSRDYQVTRFRLLANMSRSPQHGRQLYDKLARVCEQFLDVSLDYLGSVPYDNDLREAVQRQVPVTIHQPNSGAAKSFKEMAYAIDSWPVPQGVTGYLQFFVESLFQSGH